MGHVPHVYLPLPWPAGLIALPDRTRHRLDTVLRVAPGDEVSYTDGAGTVGRGSIEPPGVERGVEQTVPRPAPRLVVAVAPPQRQERARTVVEKLAELGVDRLVWLEAEHGRRRPPRADRAEAWAISALEQSRGAYRLDIAGEMATPAGLRAAGGRPLWVAEVGHSLLPSVVEGGETTVAIGPEAGFGRQEVPSDSLRFGLGSRVLRVETAAIAAAVLVLAHSGRLDGEALPEGRRQEL